MVAPLSVLVNWSVSPGWATAICARMEKRPVSAAAPTGRVGGDRRRSSSSTVNRVRNPPGAQRGRNRLENRDGRHRVASSRSMGVFVRREWDGPRISAAGELRLYGRGGRNLTARKEFF